MSDTKHEWVSEYETCDRCNYQSHRCPACGEDLDHVGYDPGGNHHTVGFCRPDLVEHEAGPLCTWPDIAENNQYRETGCYWDHENNKLKEYGAGKP